MHCLHVVSFQLFHVGSYAAFPLLLRHAEHIQHGDLGRAGGSLLCLGDLHTHSVLFRIVAAVVADIKLPACFHVGHTHNLWYGNFVRPDPKRPYLGKDIGGFPMILGSNHRQAGFLSLGLFLAAHVKDHLIPRQAGYA